MNAGPAQGFRPLQNSLPCRGGRTNRLLLAAGVASRLIAIPLIINFCVAFLTASRDVLFNIISDADALVSDAAFLFLLASLIVFIFGPGAFSVDGILKKLLRAPRKREGIFAGTMSATAGVIGECVVSTGRRFFANVVTRNCRDDVSSSPRLQRWDTAAPDER